jgi:pantoate--beta-alanine ligase
VTAERPPVVVSDRDGLRAARDGLAGTVGVVMTMGALHAGHAALLAAARESCDSVVVTIFVNPLQFGPAEDLSRYPRTLDADLEVCAKAGADLAFVPTPEVVYPGGDPAVRVTPGPLADVLEGASRPGHLDGVLTVVLKLLHLVRPHRAFFGAKDFQQLTLVRRMVRDLDVASDGVPVEIVEVPTVREPDGLALSSRNVYLSDDDRRAALALSRALRAGASAADGAGGGPACSVPNRASPSTTWRSPIPTWARHRDPVRPGCWWPPRWATPA